MAESCNLEAYTVIIGPPEFCPKSKGVLVHTSTAVTEFLGRQNCDYWDDKVIHMAREVKEIKGWGGEKSTYTIIDMDL